MSSFQLDAQDARNNAIQDLKKWQDDFLESIVKGNSCLQEFMPAGQLSHNEALKVYSDGYKARLSEALGQVYESVWGVLGDEAFFESCADFVGQEKSVDYNINHYHIKFSDYVGQRFFSEFKYIRDLAVFDWYYQELFHQPLELGLSPDEMSEILQTQDVNKIKLVSSLKIIFSPFQLGQMAQAARKNERIELSELEQGYCTLLYKSAKGIELLDLDIRLGKALQNLIKGQELSLALEELDADQISRLFELLASAKLALSLQ